MTTSYEPDPNVARLYPESQAGGFSSIDGQVEFYTRIDALLGPESHVLDFGAGRGWWTVEPVPPIARRLRWFKGRVARSVGVDVDDAVLENPSLDETLVIDPSRPLPFPDGSFDLVVADYVLEHVDAGDVAHVAGEVLRVLRPGGWFAARTPNKWGFIGIAARAVPNRLHVKVLDKVQPTRLAEDVFPTRYAMNTPRRLREIFRGHQVLVYGHTGEPAYFGRRLWVWRVVDVLGRFVPRRLSPTLHVFVRKAGEA